MSHVLLVQGDAMRVPLASGSVQCCVTSPPYWNLRDYGTDGQLGLETLHDCNGAFTGQSCGACYICHMRAVFQEVWRVLRSDGTLWVNIGDSYAANRSYQIPDSKHVDVGNTKASSVPRGLKPKDLCGIPQRLALALQADGWHWRSEVTWCKTAPMPESVRDRPSRATEKVLLFSKSPRYFYDAEAVRVDSGTGWHASSFTSNHDVATKAGLGQGPRVERLGHNLWDYWLLGPEPSTHNHFAAFPTALVERCVRAGTPQAGCCPQCRAPYVRQIEISDPFGRLGKGYHNHENDLMRGQRGVFPAHGAPTKRTTGFAPACSCITDALADGCRDPHHMDWLTTPVPSIVFDPFSGAGTTVLTARALGRHGVGMDLAWPYLQLSRDRLGLTALDAWLCGGKGATEVYEDLPLFTAKERRHA